MTPQKDSTIFELVVSVRSLYIRYLSSPKLWNTRSYYSKLPLQERHYPKSRYLPTLDKIVVPLTSQGLKTK